MASQSSGEGEEPNEGFSGSCNLPMLELRFGYIGADNTVPLTVQQ